MRKQSKNNRINRLSTYLALGILALVIVMLAYLTKSNYERTYAYAEDDVLQDSVDVAAQVESTIGFALNSIQVVSFGLSQYITDKQGLDDPYMYIHSIMAETPFNAIEFVNADGMNLTENDAAFDASDREYYINGMKGNTGVWVNFNPKYSNEVIIDFYAPVRHGVKIVGVVVGLLGSDSDIMRYFDTTFFGKREECVLLDENDNVIVSTVETTGTTSFSTLLEAVTKSERAKDELRKFVDDDSKSIVQLTDLRGKAYAGKTLINSMGWKIVTFVPNESVRAMSLENNIDVYKVVAIIFASFILMFFLLVYNDRKHLNETVRLLNMDGPTPFFRRRVYEEDIATVYNTMSDDFIYLAFDLNGLKNTNDTLGHKAGDELIAGAAACIMDAFGAYGRLYRTGGDEFVALLNCNETEYKAALNSFRTAVNNWQGEYASNLSVSMGAARHSEFPDMDIAMLGKEADRKMYIEKNLYYRRVGIDRRSMSDVYDILKDTYAKILKINLTEDSYMVLKMQDNEQLPPDIHNDISGWMTEFAASYVHPEDRERYIESMNIDALKEYFHKNNTFVLRYRRLIDGSYCDVLMELIQAKDYTEDNQSLYLFVKNITK